jgi:parallel beta-helix repeat protein
VENIEWQLSTVPPSPPVSGPGVDVFPGESIQAVVDANPAGTTFYLRAGVHTRQSIRPDDGDKFIGEAGTILDGDSSVEHAFRSGATNVTIQNLTIENYTNPAQTGAVDGAGKAWRIVDNEIRYNWGGGITFNDQWQIIGNNIHHNRQIGIKGRGDNVLVEGNEIAYNNYRDDYDPGWEAGGTKFLRSDNLVVRNNYVHDNHGYGLWTDYDNTNTLYEGNIAINNHGAGIFHEVSYNAIIRNNRVEGNGFQFSQGGIKIANSPNVEVYGNTLKNNDGGVWVVQNDRGSGSQGPFVITNLWVHNNTISFSNGYNGVVINHGGNAYYTEKNNRFDRNNYNISADKPFHWMGNKRTPQEWTNYGQDPNGTIN